MKRMVGGLLALVGLWLGTASAAEPGGQLLVYDILRNGTSLGTQRFAVQRGEDGVRVDLQTEINYKLMSLALYSFHQNGHELWRNGKLVELATDTDDNGKNFTLRVGRGDDGRLTIHSASQSLATAGELAAATLWNREALSFAKLIDSIDGSILQIEVDDGGDETVMVGGHAEVAHRYKVTGGLRRELWYHRDGRLLRTRFTASDGSVVEYRLVTGALP